MEMVRPIEPTTAAERVREVYEAEHARLWRSVYGFSSSRSVADESVAEAFAQALRRGEAIDDVRAWVWRSAFAIARGELQRRSKRDAAERAETETDQRSDLRPLLASLAGLSADDRELIVLCHIGGWTPTELAPVLGASGATLRVRLHRANRRARELLENES